MSKFPKVLQMGGIYGRLNIIGLDGSKMRDSSGKVKPPSVWWYLCKCSCGKIVSKKKGYLTSGETRSCGCLAYESRSKNGINSRKTNRFEVEGSVVKLFFFNAQGEYTTVDTEDYVKVKDFCWFKKSSYSKCTDYVAANSRGIRNTAEIMIHQLINPCKQGFVTDHIDGNGLNNCKSNLRSVSSTQNQMNKRIRKDNVTGVVGVHWNKKNKNWLAEITVENRQLYLGSFSNFYDAVKVRKEAEEKYFGEYSYRKSRGK